METTSMAVVNRDSAAAKAEPKTVAKDKRETKAKSPSEEKSVFVEVKSEEARTKNESEGQGPGKVEDKEVKLGFEFELATKKLTFQVDDETDKVVVKVVDAKSGEEIRQIPSDELLDLAERLEEYKGRIINRVL